MQVDRIIATLLKLSVAFHPIAAVAVSQSANGTGQVLIYPYYTVRDSPSTRSPFNTLFSIVNSSSRGKVVKVRFREAKAGANVFEANIFLSLRDVWTAAVIPFDDGAGLMTADQSCTRPSLAAETSGRPAASGIFLSDAYASDPLGPAIERVREGFVEVMELGTIREGSALDRATTHIAGIAPCNIASDAAIVADLDPPSGQLYGSLTLVNVLEGTAYSYDAVALANWSRVVLYSPPGTGVPTLADANPASSSVIDGNRLIISTWASGIEAVNAVLSAGSLQHEFMRDPTVNGATDVAYTMPTKPLLVTATRAIPPFLSPLTPNGSCEPSLDPSLSREEQLYDPNQSSFPALVGNAALCWVTTVQSFNAIWPAPSAVVGSQVGLRHFKAGVEVFPTPTIYPSGVAFQYLAGQSLARDVRAPGSTLYVDTQSGTQTQVQGVVYSGLPVVGVNFMRFINGALSVGGVDTLSNYGAGSATKVTPAIGVQ